jgi:hypothetical protein
MTHRTYHVLDSRTRTVSVRRNGNDWWWSDNFILRPAALIIAVDRVGGAFRWRGFVILREKLRGMNTIMNEHKPFVVLSVAWQC